MNVVASQSGRSGSVGTLKSLLILCVQCRDSQDNPLSFLIPPSGSLTPSLTLSPPHKHTHTPHSHTDRPNLRAWITNRFP